MSRIPVVKGYYSTGDNGDVYDPCGNFVHSTSESIRLFELEEALRMVQRLAQSYGDNSREINELIQSVLHDNEGEIIK